jgi:hypothetical protein
VSTVTSHVFRDPSRISFTYFPQVPLEGFFFALPNAKAGFQKHVWHFSAFSKVDLHAYLTTKVSLTLFKL